MRHRTWRLLVITCSLGGLSACNKQEPAPPPAAEAPTPAAQAAEPEPPAPAPAPAPQPRANLAVQDVGLKTPESVLHDVDADVYLVSNVNGGATDVDGNGFISRINPDGSVDNLKWIDGEKKGVTLDGPKGMGISDGVLYVADITFVRKFDAKSGEPKGEVEIEGASFLNDIAVGPDGAVYVSDSGMTGPKFEPTGSDAVYVLKDSGPEALAKSTDLARPNGLLVDDKGLWVVSYGANELYRLEDGKKVDVQKLPKGSLDGLVKDADGNFLVSSWEGQEILRGTAGGPFTLVIAQTKGPADIGYDAKRKRLLIPRFMDDLVQIVSI